MAKSSEIRQFERLIEKADPGGKLLRAWELPGGVSAQVTALENAQAEGQTRKMVVRRHGAVDLAHNPRIAADEFRLLQILHSAGLPTPAPYYLEESGDIFPTPCLVIEFMVGQTEFAPHDWDGFLRQLATHLVQIHSVDCSVHDLSFLPDQAASIARKLSAQPARFDDSIDEGRIRAALAAAWPLQQRNASVLLHGDYWPGNVLWQDGRLVAIIDWEDAALGDPLADVGSTRLEIAMNFNIDAMHSFTEHYAALTSIDLTNLPYWDLAAALRTANNISAWAVDASDEKRMRDGLGSLVSQVFEQLAAQGTT